MPVAAEVGKLGRELSLARVGVSEMAERPDDLLDAIRLIAAEGGGTSRTGNFDFALFSPYAASKAAFRCSQA